MNIADFLESRLSGELSASLERKARKLSADEVQRLLEEWTEIEYNLPLPAPVKRQTIVTGLSRRAEIDRALVSKLTGNSNVVDVWDEYPPSDFFKTVVTYADGANLRYLRKMLLVYDRVVLPFNGRLAKDMADMYRLDGYWISVLIARLRILKPFLDRGLIHLCPVNNLAAEAAVPYGSVGRLLAPISDDEFYWSAPDARFMSVHYVEAIGWAYRLGGFLSTNHAGVRDTIHQMLGFLNVDAGRQANLRAVSPFSLLLHSIEMPALERLSAKDQAGFSEQVFHYQKFRSLVDRFCEQMAGFPQDADSSALVEYGQECARDTFEPAVQSVLPKSIPTLLKDTATTVGLSFLGLQAIHGVPMDAAQVRQLLLETAAPTLAILLKDLAQSARQGARNRLFLNHCSLFMDAKYDRLTADVIPTRIGLGA